MYSKKSAVILQYVYNHITVLYNRNIYTNTYTRSLIYTPHQASKNIRHIAGIFSETYVLIVIRCYTLRQICIHSVIYKRNICTQISSETPVPIVIRCATLRQICVNSVSYNCNICTQISSETPVRSVIRCNTL